jgi:Ca-activated chloride channel family protein
LPGDDWFFGIDGIAKSTMSAVQHILARPQAIWLLATLPLLGILALLAQRWRRWAILQFGGAIGIRHLQMRSWRPTLRSYALVAGMASLVVGIAGPQWGRDRDQSMAPGRDLVVVLDLSLSMLAKDIPGTTSESRLGQALAAAKDLADAAEKRGGHRLALVVFAAKARVVCPLTQDYDHFREALGQIDPFDPLLEIGPSADASSGTRIGQAIQEGVRLLLEEAAPGYQDIVLLSDGDDPAQDNEWQTGAELARRQNIPVHTVGLGDPSRPSPIPIPGSGDLRYHGNLVTTRLEETPLEEIADRTGGTYTPARTKALPLAELLYGGRELKEDPVPVYQKRYTWFYALALAFLAIPMCVQEISRVPRLKHSETVN